LISVKLEGQAAAGLRAMSARVKNMKPYMKQVGVQVRDYYQRGFAVKGAIDGHKAWTPISATTAMLRVRGKGGKIRTMEEAKSRAAAMNPLMDTGNLRRSMTFNAANNYVEIGTNQPGYENQNNHTVIWQNSAEKADRLRRNVSAILPGKPSSEGKTYSADGTKVRVNIPGVGFRWVKRATKRYNAFYFQMKNAMSKSWIGKSFKVPKRDFIYMTQALRQKIDGMFVSFWNSYRGL